MALNSREEGDASCSADAMKTSKTGPADGGSEWRSWDQLEASPPSTSPAWNSEEDEDCGSSTPGTRPSDLYGKFTWKIENFSQRSKRELRSNMFEVGGYKWYILVYPQGCDVCNHLSLFLCVADYDKLLPGWSHFVQFTIAVVNKDIKKSKYSDTLHRFCKKEHDWGWKKFMELSKVLDSFTVADTLVIKAQVQVIRENPHRPFRCLDCQYRRVLVRVYMTNVEGICRRFVEEKREKIGKLIDDHLRWASFRSFWEALEENARRRLSREKTEIILKAIVKSFFNEKEVTSTLVMDALYSGCKTLDYCVKSKKGKINGVELEETRSPVVWVDRDSFILAGDVLLLLERAAHEAFPSYKDEKGPQNRTKNGGSEDDFGKDTWERDERRLIELGRRTVEMFVLAHLFSNHVEVEYLEAIALKRQEELIREEEAAGQAEIELKARREAAEKEKRNKKKQAKQRRTNRKEKERDTEEKQPRGTLSEHAEGLTSSRAYCSLSKETSRTSDVVDDDDDSSVLDSMDGIVGTLRPTLEEGDADRSFCERDGLEFYQLAEASFSGSPSVDSSQNGLSNRKKQSLPGDSSSTCSSDSNLSNNATLESFSRRRLSTVDQPPCSANRVKGWISDRKPRVGNTKGVLRGRPGSGSLGSAETNIIGGVYAGTVIASLKQRVQWLQQRLQEKEEEVVLLHKQLSLYQHHYGCDVLCVEDLNNSKASECCQSQPGSDSVLLSPSRENSESMKNGVTLADDFQHVRTAVGESASCLPNNSLVNENYTILDRQSGLHNIPVASLLKFSSKPRLHPVDSPHDTPVPSAMYDNATLHGLTERFMSTSQPIPASGPHVESAMVRPSSAPSPPDAPLQSTSSHPQSHLGPLARSVSATGSESTSSGTQLSFPAVPSYRNSSAGVIRSNQVESPNIFSEPRPRSQTSNSHTSGSEGYRVAPTLSGIGDQSVLAVPVHRRNLPTSDQEAASKAKTEALIQGFNRGSPLVEFEKLRVGDILSNQEPEHQRSGAGLTFGTVTPEVLHLQHPQLRYPPGSIEGNTVEGNIMPRELECLGEHQLNGRHRDNEFAQQQMHGVSHSATLTKKGAGHEVGELLVAGRQTRRGGPDLLSLTPGMPEDFPHLDIINELLDEDRLLGAKALNDFLQQPVSLHELQRMYGGRVCMDMDLLHGSAEQSDNIIQPHDNGGVLYFSNAMDGVLGGEPMHLHPYAHSSMQCSIGPPVGMPDTIPGHHWQVHPEETSMATGSNSMQVELDMLMGYPMPSPHLPVAECPSFSHGQNGYPIYSPIKHL